MPERGFSEIPEHEVDKLTDSDQAQSEGIERAAVGQPRRVSRRAFASGFTAYGVTAALGRPVLADQEPGQLSQKIDAMKAEAGSVQSTNGQNELLPNAENKELIDYLETTRAENLPPIDLFKIHKEYTQTGTADSNAMTPPELRLLFELDKEGYVVVRYHYVDLEANNFLFYLKESEDKGEGGRAVVVKANQGEYQLKNDQDLQAAFYTDENGQVHYRGDVIRAVQEDGAGGYISLASSDREAGLGLTGEVRKVTLADLKEQSVGNAADSSGPNALDKSRKLAVPGRFMDNPESDSVDGGSIEPAVPWAAAGAGIAIEGSRQLVKNKPEGGWRKALKNLFGQRETKVVHVEVIEPETEALNAPQPVQALEGRQAAALSAPANPQALEAPSELPALPSQVPTRREEVPINRVAGQNGSEDERRQ